MPQPLILPAGQGDNYAWSQDHIFVKAPHDFTAGRVTLVEDHLKPGFHLPRHHHKRMVEIFYILEGVVEFAFDDQTVTATAGMTIAIPTGAWHEVTCAQGGRLLTIFSPGGFDQYLQALAALSPDEMADEAGLTALAEQYDTWQR